MSRTPGGARMARPGTPGVEAARERELLPAVRRHGKLTVAGVALGTSLSVEEAGRMLSGLAGTRRLDVRVERGRLLYSLREGRG